MERPADLLGNDFQWEYHTQVKKKKHSSKEEKKKARSKEKLEKTPGNKKKAGAGVETLG